MNFIYLILGLLGEAVIVCLLTIYGVRTIINEDLKRKTGKTYDEWMRED